VKIMEKLKIILIAVAAVVLILVIIGAVIRIKKSKGRKAEKKVAGVLRKAGKKRKCRLINNAYLPLYKGSCEVDHILIGNFGVLVVETKGISGTVSGNGKNLTHKIGSRTHTLYNPQLQNKTHIDNVSYHLQKAGYRDIPVRGVVVFSADDVKLETNAGIYLSDLTAFVGSLRDAGCPAEKVYEYLNGIRIRNPFKKLAHDIKVGMKDS
jgi:hypothetical protein